MFSIIISFLGNNHVTNFHQLVPTMGQVGENSEAKIENPYTKTIQFQAIILVVKDAVE